MSKPNVPIVTPHLMESLMDSFDRFWLAPLSTFDPLDSKDLQRRVGQCEGVAMVMDWLNKAYETNTGRPYHVFRKQQTHTSTNPDPTPGPTAHGG